MSDADRVTEVSLSGSGALGVLSWGDTEPELVFELPEGPLRLRASFSGLAAADAHPDNDLAGEELSPNGSACSSGPRRSASRRRSESGAAERQERTTRTKAGRRSLVGTGIPREAGARS